MPHHLPTHPTTTVLCLLCRRSSSPRSHSCLLYALLCCALQGAGWPLARGAQSGSMTDWTPHFKGPAGRLARGGSDPQSEGIVVAS